MNDSNASNPKYRQHPLRMLFNNYRLTHENELLNWIQDLGLVSDLVMTLEDAPWCDCMRVMKRSRAKWCEMYFQ